MAWALILNYYMIIWEYTGLYWDNGKENGNYYIIIWETLLRLTFSSFKRFASRKRSLTNISLAPAGCLAKVRLSQTCSWKGTLGFGGTTL